MFDKQQILEKAKSYEVDMAKFLRDILVIPSESCQEEGVVQRIKEEMENVGFDEVIIDPMENILGRIGSGSAILAIDSHVDTVGVGNRDQWQHHPFKPKNISQPGL